MKMQVSFWLFVLLTAAILDFDKLVAAFSKFGVALARNL
jgi:hypothetical protein